MKFFTKKRAVLFLLFIFPLICFLILSTGENNFKKLPVLTQNVIDVVEIDSTKSVQLKESVFYRYAKLEIRIKYSCRD